MRVGILITHGTDTLAWSHAFIRYAIKNNHANIVLTGSQIPMPAIGEFSDAYENLENSMRFLTGLVPPNIITVFNYGKQAFSDSLIKIHRWDNNAFAGDWVAIMEWDEIKFHDDSVQLSDPPMPLDRFYLITTGGTIESEFDEEGVLVPGQDYVLGYLSRKFSSFFKDLSRDPVFAIDSSDMTFDRMKKLAQAVASCLQETNVEASVDLNFNPNVRIIYLDPFKTADQYERECSGADGIIIAGYGGGNVSIDSDSRNSLLSVIKHLKKNNIPVVLSSQVSLGTADFIYKNGYEAIKAGAYCAADMSLPECQVRLSYLLGHKQAIGEFAAQSKEPLDRVIERLFVAGVKFRTRRSRMMYEKLRGFQVHKQDLLINRTMRESLSQLLQQ